MEIRKPDPVAYKNFASQTRELRSSKNESLAKQRMRSEQRPYFLQYITITADNRQYIQMETGNCPKQTKPAEKQGDLTKLDVQQ